MHAHGHVIVTVVSCRLNHCYVVVIWLFILGENNDLIINHQ